MRLMALRNRVMPWLVPLALLGLLAMAVFTLWPWVFPSEKPPVGAHVPATPAPALAQVETVATPIKSGTVQTYKTAAKTRLKLPPAIQSDPHQSVVAASRVEPDAHAYTLTTLVDIETGAVQTLQRREPLPWLARDSSGRLDMLLGQSDEGTVARLSVQQNLLQVKALRLGVAAALTQHLGGQGGTDWLVGVNLGTTW